MAKSISAKQARFLRGVGSSTKPPAKVEGKKGDLVGFLDDLELRLIRRAANKNTKDDLKYFQKMGKRAARYQKQDEDPAPWVQYTPLDRKKPKKVAKKTVKKKK
jgi:hypothetical protein